MESYYEIETTCKRAARASGFSWGVAEEIGKAVRSLEMIGLPGIKTFHDYLEYSKKNKLENLSLINAGENKSENIFCPIKTSVAILDDCKKLFLKNKDIRFSKIAYPLLLIPTLNRVSNIIGQKIQLSFDEINIVLNYNQSVVINTQGPFPSLVDSISIKSIDGQPSYEKNQYNDLYKLSLETFVEESEGKLSGAGAGLTDND